MLDKFKPQFLAKTKIHQNYTCCAACTVLYTKFIGQVSWIVMCVWYYLITCESACGCDQHGSPAAMSPESLGFPWCTRHVGRKHGGFCQDLWFLVRKVIQCHTYTRSEERFLCILHAQKRLYMINYCHVYHIWRKAQMKLVEVQNIDVYLHRCAIGMCG